MPMPPRYTKATVKKGTFLIGYGSECLGRFGHLEAAPHITKGKCPTAAQLQQQAPSLQQIGQRIEEVTTRLGALAKALHEAKAQRP